MTITLPDPHNPRKLIKICEYCRGKQTTFGFEHDIYCPGYSNNNWNYERSTAKCYSTKYPYPAYSPMPMTETKHFIGNEQIREYNMKEETENRKLQDTIHNMQKRIDFLETENKIITLENEYFVHKNNWLHNQIDELKEKLKISETASRAWKMKAKEYRINVDMLQEYTDKNGGDDNTSSNKLLERKYEEILDKYLYFETEFFKLYHEKQLNEQEKEYLEDGFGSRVPVKCSRCGGKMYFNRPGDARCENCDE